jgi:hypothetical protein
MSFKFLRLNISIWNPCSLCIFHCQSLPYVCHHRIGER